LENNAAGALYYKIKTSNGSTVTREWGVGGDNSPDQFQIRDITGAATRLTIASDGAVDLVASKLTIGGGSGDDGDVLTSDGAGNIAWEAGGGTTIGTTTTSSSLGEATYNIDFLGNSLQRVIIDADCTSLILTNSNLGAARTVTLLIDLITNAPFVSSITAPSWESFTNDIGSVSVGSFIKAELISWGTTDGEVTADVNPSVS